MKKIFSGLLVLTVALIPNLVKAKELVVNTENDLRSCLKENGNVCKLGKDITLETSSQLSLTENSKIILDLNGKTISESNLGFTGGILIVSKDSELVINDSSNGDGGIVATDSYAAIQVDENSKLTINNGNFIGYWYALAGNGTKHDTEITINDGIFKVIAESEAPGIYHPQRGVMTINGGYIEGTLGIEIRSGKLIVNDGTIVGTVAPTSSNPNGSGTTSEGAGIAIAQHTTKLDLNVVINGGTIKGYSSIYQTNPQKNDQESINKVTIELNGGNFEAINNGTQVVYSENKTAFITGGTYNIAPEAKYIKDGYVIKKSENNSFVVTPNTIIKTEDGNVSFEGDKLPNDWVLKVEETVLKETAKDKILTSIKDIIIKDEAENTIIKNAEVLAVYDINVIDSNNNIVIIEGTDKYKISFKLDENLISKYDFFKVVYIDKNGNIKETFDATLNEDGTISFITNHLSTYSIIGYNVETDSVKDSNTLEVKNPNTFDGIGTYAILGLVSLIGLALTTFKLKRENM